ncbi:hypothetical protein EG329_011109 [Mollisiaceae sp. DMI_Dod_QoI]|nr:hypothetical protein EG329_011109 [Helotiales sp. DMI_Dod_QoI]
MRGNKGTCLLCRHALGLRSFPRDPKRFASTHHPEPYVLPRLVIDLDAADSKYVRKAEELEEWYPASSKRPFPPRDPPLVRRPIGQSPLPFKTKNVTPPDLLTFALMGDPSRVWDLNTQYLRNIYRYRRIQSGDGVNAKALQLTSEYAHDAMERLDRAGFREYKEKRFIWQLETCCNRGGFIEVARMVSMLSSTPKSCLFLASKGNVVLSAIRSCRKNQNYEDRRTIVTSEMLLQFFNNLRINMESKGVDIGPDICYSALYYASKSWNLPAVRTYLKILSEKSYRPSSSYQPNFSHRSLPNLILRLLYEPEKATMPIGLETVKLITGWDGSGSPATHETRNISFVSVFNERHKNNRFCSAYLTGLAEMGLRDMLQAEWQADPKYAVKLWKEDARLKAYTFALAFLVAGDKDHALSILQSVPKDHTEETILTDTLPSSDPQSRQKDSLTDDATKNDWLVQHLPTFMDMFEHHYLYHNVRPDPQLSNNLQHALQHLPRDPQQILNTFEKFIVHGYRAPITGSKISPKTLHWLDKDGVQGLVVMGEAEHAYPLYWKPAT